MPILKWSELTQEQRDKIIDYDVSAECIRDDAYESAIDYRDSLKHGEDAVFLHYTDVIDWWDNMDEEYQQDILNEPTTGS